MRNTHPDPAATEDPPAPERNALLLRRHPCRPPVAIGLRGDRRGRPRWAGLLLPLLVLAMPAHAAWMVPSAPNKAKDFTIVKRDGWYHCFYIRRDTSVPLDSTERDFGHAVSRDLYLWSQLPTVLPIRPGHWDNTRVWAPDIREIDGVYYMFYTGVTTEPGAYAFHQRIGLATSTDLMTWNRMDEPVMSCGQVRWSLCDPLQYSGGEFRDAFVMPDVDGTGWLMYYTARPSSYPDSYIAGMAASSGDLTQWTNLAPLWVTHDTWSGSPVVESPHVFSHDGLYYLLFTGNGTQPLRLATGPDPAGEVAAWTYRGTLGSMLGVNTAEWFASEHFVDGTHEYLCFINFDRVDIREIVWGAGWQFSLKQPDLFHVQRLSWNTTQADSGQGVRLRIEAVNTFGQQVKLEAVEVDADGSEQPIPLAQIGLPDSIAMSGPVTDYWWTARDWPDPEEADRKAEIVIRLTDHTAASPPITVAADPWTYPDWTGPVDRTPRVPREFSEPLQASASPALRALHRSPLGGSALLVDLAEPASVRIEIFDLAGRRVRELADRLMPAGATVIPWDGRDAGGAPVRPGVYFARLASGGLERTVRVLASP